MARMGSSKHLKRLAAPEFWPIARKEYKWVVKSTPGPHPQSRSLPLLVIVRDVLKVVETSREAIRIISEGLIKVDGKVRKNYKFPVGFMDVIEFTPTKEFFRVIPIPVKTLGLIPIDAEEATFKLCRIENKTTVKGGHIQLNLHDGRNVLVKVSDPKSPVEDIYETLGTVKISLKDGGILEYYPLKEGSISIVLGGRNVGKVAKLVAVSEGVRHYRKQVKLQDFRGNYFFTTLDKIMIIGTDKPVIKLPEGSL